MKTCQKGYFKRLGHNFFSEMLREILFFPGYSLIKQGQPTQCSYLSRAFLVLALRCPSLPSTQLDTHWLQYKLRSSVNQINSNQAEKSGWFYDGTVTWIKINNFDFKKFLSKTRIIEWIRNCVVFCVLPRALYQTLSYPPSAGRQMHPHSAHPAGTKTQSTWLHSPP